MTIQPQTVFLYFLHVINTQQGQVGRVVGQVLADTQEAATEVATAAAAPAASADFGAALVSTGVIGPTQTGVDPVGVAVMPQATNSDAANQLVETGAASVVPVEGEFRTVGYICGAAGTCFHGSCRHARRCVHGIDASPTVARHTCST
jgi:hypothetical protein